MRIFLPLLLLVVMLLAAFLWRRAEPAAELTTVNSVSVRTLDPQRMSWNHDIRMGYALFEGLLTYDSRTMDLIPGVAESLELSDDHLTYTFHLRPDARWSNGDPLTADDFRFAWRMGLMPENAADYTDFFMHLRGAEAFFQWASDSLKQVQEQLKQDHATGLIAARRRLDESAAQFDKLVGVRVPDPHTLVVTLAHPVAYFDALVAFPTLFPLHRPTIERFTHIDPDSGAAQRSAQWTKAGNMVGNGPFMLAGWRFKQDLLLVRNEHYWNAAHVKLRSLRVVNIENYNTAFLAYQTGAVNLFLDVSPLNVSPELLELAAQHRRDDVHATDWFGTYYYLFNMRPTLADGSPNPLADPRVRRALALTVDKNAIVTHVTRLRQTVAHSLVPPGTIAGYSPPAGHSDGSPGYDPELARRLLAEAGHPGGRDLPVIELLYNTGGGHENVAQAIKQMWEQNLGVRVDAKGLELKVFADRVHNGDFMVARKSWIGDYPDPTTFLDLFTSGGSSNDGKFNDETYDHLLQQASVTLDAPARFDLLHQAEQRLIDLQGLLPIYHYKIIYLYNPRLIHGVSLHPRGVQFYGQMWVGPSGKDPTPMTNDQRNSNHQ